MRHDMIVRQGGKCEPFCSIIKISHDRRRESLTDYQFTTLLTLLQTSIAKVAKAASKVIQQVRRRNQHCFLVQHVPSGGEDRTHVPFTALQVYGQEVRSSLAAEIIRSSFKNACLTISGCLTTATLPGLSVRSHVLLPHGVMQSCHAS